MKIIIKNALLRLSVSLPLDFTTERLFNMISKLQLNVSQGYKGICFVAKVYTRIAVHNLSTYKKIPDAYAGKSVFITGGTGFLGKVLTESLLYNCRDINNIYLLLRPKNGVSTEQRLKDMFNLPLFKRLRTNRPEDLSKVIGIEGDLVKPQLGIKPTDREELVDKVSIVIHSGATVRFNETFQNIFDVNYEGTRRILDLGKRMNKLEVKDTFQNLFDTNYEVTKTILDLRKRMSKLETFLYVSTAFSNYGNTVIEECLYPNDTNIDAVRKFIAEHGEDQKKVRKFIGNTLNTYTYTKCLAEALVERERGDMPTILIRPGQITAMSGPPLPGWMDSWVSAPALYNDVAEGRLKVAILDDSILANLVPVDYVSNMIIAAAAQGNQSKDILFYNCCSSSDNPVTYKYCIDYFLKEKSREAKSKNMKPPSKFSFARSKLQFHILAFVREIVPAVLADFRLRLQGHQPRYMKSLRRPRLLRKMTHPTISQTLLVKTEQFKVLVAAMDEEDKKTFPCDIRQINWAEYIPVLYKGIQNFNKTK